jgi:hypothetical protein
MRDERGEMRVMHHPLAQLAADQAPCSTVAVVVCKRFGCLCVCKITQGGVAGRRRCMLLLCTLIEFRGEYRGEWVLAGGWMRL